MEKNPVLLRINCGFARVAIVTHSQRSRGRQYTLENRQERTQKFRKQFMGTPSFGIDSTMFSDDGRGNQFDRCCKQILATFNKKLHRDSRKQYCETFSTEAWNKLPSSQKALHTLTNCRECALQYHDQQLSFPGPIYEPPRLVTSETENLARHRSSNKAEKDNVTRQVLSELNSVYESVYGHSFTQAVVELPHSDLQKKPTNAEKKKQKRQIQRECRDTMAKQFRETDALTVLSEGQSLRSYKRQRMASSFETPTQKQERTTRRPPKQRKHSPSFDKVTWDKEAVLTALKNWPEGEKIVWSKFAREHNIPGGNGGQVAKEFAKENDIDVEVLGKSNSKQRNRSCKLKLPGANISVPTHRTVAQIKEDWQAMLEKGELTLGEQCHPCTLTTYSTKGGELQTKETTVYGRKIPLLTLRRKLLKKHEKLMYLHTEEELTQMSITELTELAKAQNIYMPNGTAQEIREKIAKSERTRHIAMWHDHSTILGRGYVLVTIKLLYDHAVFKSDDTTNQSQKDLQAYIEEPEIHIIALSSSSVDDQTTLIDDRLECMKELSTPVTSSTGIEITDKLIFFCGDKPAAQFERGTQIGGNYPSGSCGCRAERMDDLAYSLHCSWKSYKDLQSFVLSGKHGSRAGAIKPFESLNSSQLQEELRARKEYDYGNTKKDRHSVLMETLQGVQRVPTLLINNPTQNLQELNLQNYNILDCEPLHDLKGHMQHVLTELPSILDEPLKTDCARIIDIDLHKDKKTAADYRLTAIHVLACLKKHNAASDVCRLVETLVNISEILYADDSERTPRMVLRLYNITWMHHELCSQLFTHLKHTTHRAFFGIYLHALVVHAPKQLEIVSLKSCNSEHEERLFGQAKDVAQSATNRQPQNIVPNILLRIQAKQKQRDLYNTLHTSLSRVAKEARNIQVNKDNSVFSQTFLTCRMHSWQAHLQSISQFLLPGKGVWWKADSHSYEFLDGSEEEDFNSNGPIHQHFRNTPLPEVYKEKANTWTKIVNDNVELPTPYIKLYDNLGNFAGLRYFGDSIVSANEVPQGESTSQLHEFQQPESAMEVEPTQPTATVSEIQAHKLENTEFVQPELAMDIEATTVLENHTNDTELENNEAHLDIRLEQPEIDTEAEECSTSEEPLPIFKTKLAAAIHSILPAHITSESSVLQQLQQFDALRHKIKHRPSTSQDEHKLNQLLLKFKEKLSKSSELLQSDIRKYETSYFMDHNELPSLRDNTYYSLTRSYRRIVKLLSTQDFTDIPT